MAKSPLNTGIVKFNIRVGGNGILFEINSARVIIKGKRVNRGAGYGLEVPCEYHFEGDNVVYIRDFPSAGSLGSCD